MTFRSIFLGLMGAALICGVTFFNDRILRGTYLIGNNLPIAVYGLLIIFAVFINPFLKRLALKGHEIAVVLALTLAACTIPSSGLLRTFPGVLILPRHYEKTEAGWRGDGTELRESDVADWEALLATLREASAEPEDSAGDAVCRRIPEPLRSDIAAGTANPDDGSLRGDLVGVLNEIIDDPTFAAPAYGRDLVLSDHVQWLLGREREALSQAEVSILNRGMLDVLFEDALKPRTPGIIEEVPRQMLADTSRDEDTVLGGFIQGMGEGSDHVEFSRIPWGDWSRTLLFWIPVVLCLWGALVAASLVVHRQWSVNEHLPYPVAGFTDALFPRAGETRNPLFRDRLFWIAAVLVLAIHLNNYLYQWFPDYLIPIQTKLQLAPIAYKLFPTLVRGGGAWLLNINIYFIVIGIAYFIPTDVSLGFAVGPFLWAYAVGALAGYGVSLDGTIEGASWWMGLKPRSFVIFGSVLGVFLALLYTGRHHYMSLLRSALSGRRDKSLEAYEVWGLRAFTVLVVLLVVQLAYGAGTGLALATLYTAIVIIGFVVTSRVIAETGLFHIQIAVFPCVILWGLFGAGAITPRTLLVLQIVSMVLLIDPRESLMPFMVNSLKVVELRKVSLGRTASLAAVALVLGLAVGLPVTMYIQYDHGRTWDRWAEEMVPKMPFENVAAVRNKLAGQGALDLSPATAGDRDLLDPSPDALCVWSLLVGLALVLVFTFGRLRYAWWPLHPLMFALWATNHVKHFAGAFFLGWLIKTMVAKYGGSHTYNRVKPLMMGLIAGEILGAVVPCIVGAVYYAFTGDPPKSFLVLPG